MSLDSFFDTLDTESSTIQKLNTLQRIIPTENIVEIRYVVETIEFIGNITIPWGVDDKKNILQKLNTCNLYYKTFGV